MFENRVLTKSTRFVVLRTLFEYCHEIRHYFNNSLKKTFFKQFPDVPIDYKNS